MNDPALKRSLGGVEPIGVASTCQSIDWYAEGESKILEVAGTRITVRYVGRKGRRGRICITAPGGTSFIADAQ